jgi:hypothetical protein
MITLIPKVGHFLPVGAFHGFKEKITPSDRDFLVVMLADP